MNFACGELSNFIRNKFEQLNCGICMMEYSFYNINNISEHATEASSMYVEGNANKVPTGKTFTQQKNLEQS